MSLTHEIRSLAAHLRADPNRRDRPRCPTPAPPGRGAWERPRDRRDDLAGASPGPSPRDPPSPSLASLRSFVVHDDSRVRPVTSPEDLDAENERLRLQLAEARRESYSWRVHVQGIAESRAVIVARMMSQAFPSFAPPGSQRRRWSGRLTEGVLWLRRRGQPSRPTRRAATASTTRTRVLGVRRFARGPPPSTTSSPTRSSRSSSSLPTATSPPPSSRSAPRSTTASRSSSPSEKRSAATPRSSSSTASGTERGPRQRRGREARASSSWCCWRATSSPRTASSTSSTAVQDGADAAYGDEDRYDERPTSTDDGHLKPAASAARPSSPTTWSARRCSCARELFTALGGLDAACAPVAAHDFALRLAERTERIAHVAEVLCQPPAALAADPFDATAATIPVVPPRDRSDAARPRPSGRARCCRRCASSIAPPTPRRRSRS